MIRNERNCKGFQKYEQTWETKKSRSGCLMKEMERKLKLKGHLHMHFSETHTANRANHELRIMVYTTIFMPHDLARWFDMNLSKQSFKTQHHEYAQVGRESDGGRQASSS